MPHLDFKLVILVVLLQKKDNPVSKVRTSYGAWLSHSWRDQTVEEIEKRIHNVVGIPREFGEGIYVLRYEQDQKYDPHTDNCARKVMNHQWLLRLFTKLLPLTKVFSGGRTQECMP